MSDTIIVELLPCPLCGSQVLQEYKDLDWFATLQCAVCGLNLKRYCGKGEGMGSAWEALRMTWNKRAPVPGNVKLESA